MGVRLVATTVLQYAGQRYTPGEPFTARTRDDARFLTAAKRAVDEPTKRARKATPPPQALQTDSFEVETGSLPESVTPTISE